MRRTSFLAAAVVLMVDQLSKVWALNRLDDGSVIQILGRFLRLQLIHNAGAAFSLGSGNTWLLTIVGVCIAAVLARTLIRGVDSRAWAVTLGVVFGGAIGNLVDRLIRAPGFGRGHVVDFIDYNGFFIGNVADIAIVLGAVVLAYLSLRDVPMRHPARATDG